MDYKKYKHDIDAIIPGLTKAYESLNPPSGPGIHTSTGRFYNNTFFGRDAGMSAKFVSDFDHEIARRTIVSLAKLQGVTNNPRTHEQVGRIHHENRDLKKWKGSLSERMLMRIAGVAWGMQNQTILTYFADDTTANYIRLVRKYASHIDSSLLSLQYQRKDGTPSSIRESVIRAANWIVSSTNESGYLVPERTNKFSLPFQTFQDGATAYYHGNNKILDFTQQHGFLEAQSYSLDALQDAIALVDDIALQRKWQQTAEKLEVALLSTYWDDTLKFFNSAVQLHDDGEVKMVYVPNVSAGWTLNANFWDTLSTYERKEKVTGIVKRLFSRDFLTDYGLRTKSLGVDVSHSIQNYHGSSTVWPMFTFMVIEGLRRQRMYRLAHQLENRLIYASRHVEDFQEFYVVGENGELYVDDQSSSNTLSVQMIPEHTIGFTVVPLMSIAYRRIAKPPRKEPDEWQKHLEDEIMQSIPRIESTDNSPPTIHPVRMTRRGAFMESAKKVLFDRMD